jgi:hypothetical protein
MTKNRNDPIFVAPPKAAKASIQLLWHVAVACCCQRHYRTNFCQCKQLMKFVSETSETAKLDSHMMGTTVLALATLGGMTKDRNDPIFVAPPKAAKASIQLLWHVTDVGCCRWHYHSNFCQWKYGLRKAITMDELKLTGRNLGQVFNFR